jgi:hypothetical protein
MADLALAALNLILIFVLVGIPGAEAGLVHEGMDRMQANVRALSIQPAGWGAVTAFEQHRPGQVAPFFL